MPLYTLKLPTLDLQENNAMNQLIDTAEALEQMAQSLRDQAKAVPSVLTNVSLTDAYTRLRTALGKAKLITIRVELAFPSYGGDTEAAWTIYDGKTHHTGSTLAGVLQIALFANQAPSESVQADPVHAVQAILDPVPF